MVPDTFPPPEDKTVVQVTGNDGVAVDDPYSGDYDMGALESQHWPEEYIMDYLRSKDRD